MCVTYNHGNYIRSCLEGFLLQETTFPVEILVHDDASTDGTAITVKEYGERYPHLIRTFFQSENQWSKGVKVAHTLVRMARGEFIATCEGDDYWIAASKLTQQVAVFTRHADCVVCGGRVFVVREGAPTPYAIEPDLPPERLPQLTPEQIMRGEWYLKTLSRMVRRSLWSDYLSVVGDNRAAGDWLFVLFCVSRVAPGYQGFYCIDEVIGVYREHAGGVHFSKTAEQRMRSDLTILSFALSHFHFPRERQFLQDRAVAICRTLGMTKCDEPHVDQLLKEYYKAQRSRWYRRPLAFLKSWWR